MTPPLSPQVEQDVVLTTIIDLRPEDQMATSPLPTSELFQKCTAAMPVGNLAAALKDSAAWKLAFPDAPPHPTIEHILVFVTPDETVMEEASAIAVTYNYQRCLHLSAPASEVAAAALLAPTFIERDAAAHLLALQAQQSSPVDFVFIDLRRHDERAMYGAVPPPSPAFSCPTLIRAQCWQNVSKHPAGLPNKRMKRILCLHSLSAGNRKSENSFLVEILAARLACWRAQLNAFRDACAGLPQLTTVLACAGGISGSVHIPVETFAFAVQKDDPEFEAMCHVPKPSKDQVVVMQCRSNRRAGWAAQLAVEQGAHIMCTSRDAVASLLRLSACCRCPRRESGLL